MAARKEEFSFFENVFEVVKLIPRGRVTSYGAIAAYLGAKGSARMVGWALISSHQQNIQVPAYRVVNRNGLLSGKNHFPGTFAMQRMLEEEGVEVEEDQVVHFKTLFWDPAREL